LVLDLKLGNLGVGLLLTEYPFYLNKYERQMTLPLTYLYHSGNLKLSWGVGVDSLFETDDNFIWSGWQSLSTCGVSRSNGNSWFY